GFRITEGPIPRSLNISSPDMTAETRAIMPKASGNSRRDRMRLAKKRIPWLATLLATVQADAERKILLRPVPPPPSLFFSNITVRSCWTSKNPWRAGPNDSAHRKARTPLGSINQVGWRSPPMLPELPWRPRLAAYQTADLKQVAGATAIPARSEEHT